MNIRSFLILLALIFTNVSTASACDECRKKHRRSAPRAESGDLPSAKQYVRITIKGIDGKYRSGIRQVSSKEEALKLASERGGKKESNEYYRASQAQRGR